MGGQRVCELASSQLGEEIPPVVLYPLFRQLAVWRVSEDIHHGDTRTACHSARAGPRVSR